MQAYFKAVWLCGCLLFLPAMAQTKEELKEETELEITEEQFQGIPMRIVLNGNEVPLLILHVQSDAPNRTYTT